MHEDPRQTLDPPRRQSTRRAADRAGGGAPSSGPTALRREAVLASRSRGPVALLAALCALSGVALGFALSLFAAGAFSRAPQVVVEEVNVPPVVKATPIANARVTWLGAIVTNARGAHAKAASSSGARVLDVFPGSPAGAGGLRPGDTITRVGATHVPTGQALVRAVRAHAPGDAVTLTVRRKDGKTRALHLSLRAAPPCMIPHLTDPR